MCLLYAKHCVNFLKKNSWGRPPHHHLDSFSSWSPAHGSVRGRALLVNICGTISIFEVGAFTSFY